jgi:hypothetical protein
MAIILRRCRACGLEAHTEEDLNRFVKAKERPNGVKNICKSCANKGLPVLPKPYLKKCTDCGLEAHTEQDLELFKKRKGAKWGRKNLCKKCHSKLNKKYYDANPILERYHSMMSRCYGKNPIRNPSYKRRGIIVCDEWKKDKQAFVDWALTHRFREDLTLDRIDNNGNYSPENCRWVDWVTQERNKSSHVTFPEKQTRICYFCKQEKPFSDFPLMKSGHYGIGYTCKSCLPKERLFKKNKYSNNHVQT